ncbi:MAG: hypothetical protein ACTHJW_09665 [Streptosporangiaceae bacterium]
MTAPQAELDQAGREYLARMSDADLRALVRASAVTADRAAARIESLHRQPALLLDALDRPATSAAVLNLASAARPGAGSGSSRAVERFALISPFLLFAAAIHRTAADLAAATYAPERTAPRRRVPLFDGGRLTAYLAAPRHRLFLADLLASFARISGGVVLGSDGQHRRRWNDADPHRLAVLLDAVPPDGRPPVWRRLGDLALFLAGVFPDAAERLVRDEAAASRLARWTLLEATPSSRQERIPEGGAPDLIEWLGTRWYEQAARHLPRDEARDLWEQAQLFRPARRVLNTATDRYLLPYSADWLTAPG